MITYEQAKKKAVQRLSGVNTALEYKDAWMFYNSKAKGTDVEDNDVVVMKSSGKVMSMSEYAMQSDDTSKPKKVKF